MAQSREEQRAKERLHKRAIYATPEGRIKVRESGLKRSFGLDLTKYDAMLIRQNNVCAICSQAETAVRNGRVKHLAVDHDHATGRVRALLCQSCNTMLG